MNRPVREKDIERYFMEEVKRAGGVAFKFTSPQRRSVPDRLVLMPGGKMYFAEIKSAKGRFTEGQKREITRLTTMGFKVYQIRDKEDAKAIAYVGSLC